MKIALGFYRRNQIRLVAVMVIAAVMMMRRMIIISSRGYSETRAIAALY